MSNKHLYLYADHLFGYQNWSHEIKTQTNLFIIIFFCNICIGYRLRRFK